MTAALTSARPERILVGVAVAIVLAFVYNLAMQFAAVPSAMRYVPPESIVYVVTSPLGALWSGSSSHLQSYFDGASAPSDGAIRQLAQDAKEQLRQKGVKLTALGDLAALGIASDAGAALALVMQDGSLHWMLAVPVMNQARFIETFRRLYGEPPAAEVDGGTKAVPARPLYRAGDSAMAFGDDGAALVSDDVGLLNKVLDSQYQNLAYFRSNDRQSTGFAKLLVGPQGRGIAWIRGAVRATEITDLVEAAGSPLALLANVQFAVGFEPEAVRINVRGNVPDVRSELIERMLKPRRASSNTSNVLSRSEAAAVVADESLPYFLRYLSSDAVAASLPGFSALFPGLPQELRELATLSHISVATLELSERVPGVIVGLTMSRKEADVLQFRLQSSIRLKRDREILNQAVKQYRDSFGIEPAAPITIGALTAAGMLQPDRDALWPRYRLKGDKGDMIMNPEPPLAPNDFANASYVPQRGDQVDFHYVMPPFTDDDLAYRFADKKEGLQSDDLKRDRYRLCSAYVGDTWWLGNDADVLARWLEQSRSAEVSTDYLEASKLTPRSADAKLSVLVLPRQLLEAGQLYPDSAVNQKTRRVLTDLRQYRAALVVFVTRPNERQIDVAATLRR